MSVRLKFPRAAAMAVAKEICVALKPITERLIVAGSLRRLKAEVGDVEIVFIPKFEPRQDPSDLLERLVPTNLVVEWMEAKVQAGIFEKRLSVAGHPAWGAENKLARHAASGIGVDFFQADNNNWWSLVACRTGSAESNTAVCMAAQQRGLKWNPYKGFEDRVTGALVFVPRNEAAVFEHVGLRCLEPKER